MLHKTLKICFNRAHFEFQDEPKFILKIIPVNKADSRLSCPGAKAGGLGWSAFSPEAGGRCKRQAFCGSQSARQGWRNKPALKPF
jgi:hypothetical protein